MKKHAVIAVLQQQGFEMIALDTFAIISTVAGNCIDDSRPQTDYACENRILRICCAKNSQIHVLNASYGRQDSQTCKALGYFWLTWNLKCAAPNSLNVVRDRYVSNSAATKKNLFTIQRMSVLCACSEKSVDTAV
jgi:hypothetical protein